MKLRHFAVFGGIFTVIICLLLFLFIVTADDEESGSSSLDFSGLNLSAEVLKHQPTVEKYAKEYGISDYVNYLLAIMQVESGGTGTTDVMQASESLAALFKPENKMKFDFLNTVSTTMLIIFGIVISLIIFSISAILSIKFFEKSDLA